MRTQAHVSCRPLASAEVDRKLRHRPALLKQHHVDSRLLLAFLGVAGGLFAFFRLASEVSEGETLAIDRAILDALRAPGDISTPIGPPWLTKVFVDVTALGSVTILTVVTLITAGYLVVVRKFRTSGFVLLAAGSGALASTALKAVFLRDRPELAARIVDVSSTSFPSGHAMNSAIVYLTLGALLARSQTKLAIRLYFMAVAISLTLLVGVSRVFLGVHWTSDVAAGWCVGACWAALCSLTAKTLEKRHQLEN